MRNKAKTMVNFLHHVHLTALMKIVDAMSTYYYELIHRKFIVHSITNGFWWKRIEHFIEVSSWKKMQKILIYYERIQNMLMWLTYLVVPQYSISASFTRATLHPIQIPIKNETLTQIILGMNDIHYSADLAWRNGMETFWIILPIITASRRVQFLSCS
jgi:hypothetical protein